MAKSAPSGDGAPKKAVSRFIRAEWLRFLRSLPSALGSNISAEAQKNDFRKRCCNVICLFQFPVESCSWAWRKYVLKACYFIMPVGEHPCKTAALNMGSLLRGQRSYRVNDCMHTWQNLPFHLPLPHPQRTSERGLSLLSGFSSICCTTSAEQSRAAARMFPKALRDPAGGLAS